MVLVNLFLNEWEDPTAGTHLGPFLIWALDSFGLQHIWPRLIWAPTHLGPNTFGPQLRVRGRGAGGLYLISRPCNLYTYI